MKSKEHIEKLLDVAEGKRLEIIDNYQTLSNHLVGFNESYECDVTYCILMNEIKLLKNILEI